MSVAAYYDYGDGTAPPAPSPGYHRYYFKAGGPFYKDSTNTEYPFATGGVVGPANTVFLTTSGNDGSGARGDASKPFLSLQAALAACTSGDVLSIGAGTWTISGIDVPVTWPVGLNRLTIIGAGTDETGTNGGTLIKNTANNGTGIFTPVNTATFLEIRNLTAIVTLGAGKALDCNGSGAAGAFLGGNVDGGLVLRDCVFLGATTSAQFKYVGLGIIYNTVFDTGNTRTVAVDTSNLLDVNGSTFGSLTWTADNASGDKPIYGVQTSTFTGCYLKGSVTVTKQPDLAFVNSDLGALRGSSLTAIAGHAPAIDIEAGSVGDIDFQAGGREFPDTAEASKRLSIRATIIFSSLKLKVAGAAANRWPVTAYNCTTRDIAANNIIADAGIDLDLRGSDNKVDCSQLLTNGTGTLLVSQCCRTYTTDGTSTDTPAIDQAGVLAFTAAADYVFVTPKTLAVGFAGATPLSGTQNTLYYSVNAVGDVQIMSVWK